jgi:hypothetical protein
LGISTKDGKRSTAPLTLKIPIAGQLLGIGFQLSYAAARAGEIPTLKFGARKVVPIGWVAEMLQVPVEEVERRALAIMKAEAAS